MKDFKPKSIAFILRAFICYIFSLFNCHCICHLNMKLLLSHILPFHKDNLKTNKISIHITADRDFKELPVDLEWILYSLHLVAAKGWQHQKTKYRIPVQWKHLSCKWSLRIYLYDLLHFSCFAGFCPWLFMSFFDF